MGTPFIGTVEVEDDTNHLTMVTLDPDNAKITVGGGYTAKNLSIGAQDGKIELLDKFDLASVQLSAGDAPFGGTLVLKSNDKQQVYLGQGHLTLGGHAEEGSVHLYPSSNSTAPLGPISIRLNANDAFLGAGGHLIDGQLGLFPKNYSGGGDASELAQATIHLRAIDGTICAGAGGQDGTLLLLTPDGKSATIQLQGAKSTVSVGGGGHPGELQLLDPTGGTPWIRLVASDAYAALGGNNVFGRIGLFPTTATNNGNGNQATIFLNGETGDIVLSNADCAEDFDIVELEGLDPGTVMAIDEDGMLRPSQDAYDRKVAGVISGAGGYKPGIVLDKQQSKHKRMPVALVGKVFCKVDARYSPVGVGDLLTTSPTLGHAMKAIDPLKAFGAVIGKALRPLKRGTDLIPILIALQ